MPTQQQFQNVILSAELQMANLIESDRLKMVGGGFPSDGKEIDRYNNNIVALSYQVYGRVDYTSKTTLSLYDCLNNLVGVDTSTATLDPNYQAPNTTIIIESGGSSALDYDYDQDNLVDAGGGNWYLPFAKPDSSPFINGETPVQLTINATSSAFTWDKTTLRIYGFADNNTQTIQLTVVTTT